MSPEKKQKVTEYYLNKDYNTEMKEEFQLDEERKKRLDLIGSHFKVIGTPTKFLDNTKSFTSLFSNKTPLLKQIQSEESLKKNDSTESLLRVTSVKNIKVSEF